MPIAENWTILEYEDKGNGQYEIIACYPDYKMTSENFVKAFAAYQGISPNTIEWLSSPPDYDNYPSGKYIYADDNSGSIYMGGFSDAENKRIDQIFTSGEWESWVIKNCTMMKRYAKAKLSYSNNSFDMVNLVKQNSSSAWDYTYDFSSLSKLKAAILVEQHNWDYSVNPPTDLGRQVMTFTRWQTVSAL
jgi:hypothetical protein